MKINQYNFIVIVDFEAPEATVRMGIPWDGLEQHHESIMASDVEVARRALKKIVNKKIGPQKERVKSLQILTEEEAHGKNIWNKNQESEEYEII